MKTERLLLCLTAIVVADGCGRFGGREPITSLHKPGSADVMSTTPEVPEPKATSWTTPANDLPPDFVEAVTFLEAHGMADPRGGEFTQAYTDRLLSWDATYSQPFMTAGWLAKQADGKMRFACEDGLAYSAWRGDRRAKLDSYVALSPDGRGGLVQEKGFKPRQTVLLDNNMTLAATVSDRGDGPVAMLPGWDLVGTSRGSHLTRTPRPDMLAAMLLVDGRAEDAKHVLEGLKKGRQPILLTLATDLLKSKWTRALETYACGQDHAALDLLLDVEALRSACEERIRPAPTFPFLSEAPALVHDLRRRLAEPPRKPLTPRATIDEQLASLEDYGLPLPLWSRHLASAIRNSSTLPGDLFAAGNKAVAPLIRAAGADPRLTRQIILVGGDPYVCSVREVALRVLNALTGACFHPDRAGNLPSLERLTSWWKRSASLSVGEREFQFLADDSGDEVQWAFAAKQITGLSAVETRASAVEQRWSQLRLTTHKSPSVSDLLIRRMNQIVTTSSWPGAVCGGKVMELCLEKWDQAAAAAAARTFSENLTHAEAMRDAKDDLTHLTALGRSYVRVDPDLLRLYEMRIASKDYTAVGEYEELLRSASAAGGAQSGVFSFLYSHQAVPGFASLTRELFLDPVSHGVPKFGLHAQPLAYTVAASPLINLPTEQDAVIHLLQNKMPYATVVRTSYGSLLIAGNERMQLGGGRGLGNNGFPTPPQRWVVRVCDQVAERMLPYGGNSFRTFWPEKRKDALVNSLIQTLRRHPKHYWSQETIWL